MPFSSRRTFASHPQASGPRVYFWGTEYVSHRRAGAGYASLLAELGCLTEELAQADVVFLHIEAPHLARLLDYIPALADKYLIAYTVWETSELPLPYVQGLELVDEVWTASSFCAGILRKRGIDAFWLPHLVETATQQRPDAAAMAQVRAWLGDDPERFDVLSVTKRNDIRKDNPALAHAFAALRRHCPKARLITKLGSWLYGDKGPRMLKQPGVLHMEGSIDDATMRALMAHSQLVATASHAEGWGMSLTEAMALGVPVMAPGYSGQMTFLTQRNSIVVPSIEAPIGMHWGLFEPQALWGHTSAGALEAALIRAWSERGTAAEAQRIEQARRDTKLLLPDRVLPLMRRHMQRVARVLQGWRAPKRCPRQIDTSQKDIRVALAIE